MHQRTAVWPRTRESGGEKVKRQEDGTSLCHAISRFLMQLGWRTRLCTHEIMGTSLERETRGDLRQDNGYSTSVNTQREFNFNEDNHEQGYERWLTGRKVLVAEMARRIGLPLRHRVEVWLYGGLRLRGTLKLKEEMLFIEEESLRLIELMVDHVVFAYREMESCIRTD
jgi:hypothetical protein